VVVDEKRINKEQINKSTNQQKKTLKYCSSVNTILCISRHLPIGD